MGQQVAVTERPSPRPGVLRFETNRSLTGMGHEHFKSMSDAVGHGRPPRWPANCCRRARSTRCTSTATSSRSTSEGFNADGLGDVVRNMYQYWKPGMEMPTFDAPAEEAPAAAAAGDSAAARSSRSTTKLVPQSLRERSAAALAKWQASH